MDNKSLLMDVGPNLFAGSLQKPNKLQHLLPHKNLEHIRQNYLHNLKLNLNRAILSQDETLTQWIEAFHMYIIEFLLLLLLLLLLFIV